MTNQNWQRNYNALKLRNPDLANQLFHLVAGESRYVVGRGGDGTPMLGVRADDGRLMALSNPQQPRHEAEAWVNNLGDAVRRRGHAAIIGFGSGFHIEALFHGSDVDSVYWVIEPDPVLLKAALHLRDYSEQIKSNRFHFACGLSEKEAVRAIVNGPSIDRLKAQGIQVVYPGYSKQLYGPYIQNFASELFIAMEMERLKFRTWEGQSDTVFNNIIQNLPSLLDGVPLNRLFGKAAGMTAFVIAPGPSLEEAIPAIRERQSNALLIAVDTAHRILLKHGIEADIVVCLDFTELNVKHFENIDDPGSMLAVFPGVNPKIIEQYRSRMFYFDHVGELSGSGANPTLQSLPALGSVGNVISQGSTAHSACHIARLMGCSPIVLIGNDLGFPQSRFYADGAMQDDLDQSEREREPLLDVAANDGSTIKTNGLYKMYLDEFARVINESGANVINVSRYGAVISGAPFCELDEVLKTHASTEIDKSFIRTTFERRRDLTPETYRAEIEALAERCEETRRALRRQQKQIDKVNPNAPDFRAVFTKRYNELQAVFRQHRAPVTMSLSLCPRSYLSLTAKHDDSGILGGATADENRVALEKCLNLLTDLSNALRRIAERLMNAAERLPR